jgi:hypothetical protein
MRRTLLLACLFLAGCWTTSTKKLDTAAAREFVRGIYSNPAIHLEMNVDDEPEYVTVAKIPRERLGASVPDRSAACAVRVRFSWRDENRATHDDMIVWVNSEHKAVGWSSNTKGDKWREHVRSLAKP